MNNRCFCFLKYKSFVHVIYDEIRFWEKLILFDHVAPYNFKKTKQQTRKGKLSQERLCIIIWKISMLDGCFRCESDNGYSSTNPY